MLFVKLANAQRHSLQTEVIVKALCVLCHGSDGMASEVTVFEGRVAPKGWRPGSPNRIVLSNAGR